MVMHGDFQPWQGIAGLTVWLFKSFNCRRSGSYSMCCSLASNLHHRTRLSGAHTGAPACNSEGLLQR